MKRLKNIKYLLCIFLFLSATQIPGKKTTIFLIGDSTVRNGDGSGRNGQWGWGTLLHQYIDTNKLAIRNHAIGGRSSRTFITEGRWTKVMDAIRPGDYLLIQFGHNDGGPLDDTARARGTIRGIGNDSLRIYNPIRKVNETVFSYGYYLRLYIKEARAAGAIPVICSPIPRNDWAKGKVIRSDSSYGKWAADIAEEEEVDFIHLNHIVSAAYESLGEDKVSAFFPSDHTHTDSLGAALNARLVANEMKRVLPAGKIRKAILRN